MKTPVNLPEIVSREKWLAARWRARDVPARRVRHLSGAAETIGVCGGSEDLS